MREPAFSWADARAAAHAAPRPLPAETITLAQATGRILSRNMVAITDVPHYASSAMDGWAVAGDRPWRLVQADAPAPGESVRLEPGEAVPVLTGGLVPEGTRAVLRGENGSVSPGGLLEPSATAGHDEPTDGMHIRSRAEEAQAGETVIVAGTLLNPAHVALAAVCGHDTLPVAPRPSVGLVYTGDEVVTSGIPDPGHVRDSFGPALPALIGMLGARVSGERRVPDRLERLADAIEAVGASAQVVVTTGGTGHSSADHLREALRMRGARRLIPSVAMRPGGPSLLADLGDGRLLVGLPGNPLAAMMGLFTLLAPVLRGIQGLAPEPLVSVRVDEPIWPTPGRTRLLPYRNSAGSAHPSAWNASGMLRGLASSDGVLACPPEGVAAGASVDAFELPWRTS